MGLIKATLIKATLRVLKPLVRLLMHYEISHVEFTEMAKRAYVDAAYDYFTLPKRKQTYSRVAVLTGLSRKEVVRLAQGREIQIEKIKGSINRAARVVQTWSTDPEFTNGLYEPLTLPLRGKHPSFASLVAKSSGDIPIRAILDELVRIQVVEKQTNNTVILSQRAHIPNAEDPKLIEYFTTHVGDMIDTGTHNLLSDRNDSRLQRQLTFYDIPQSVIQEFKQLSREKALVLLNELNKWLVNKKEKMKPEPGEPTGKTGLGVYYFENLNIGE